MLTRIRKLDSSLATYCDTLSCLLRQILLMVIILEGKFVFFLLILKAQLSKVYNLIWDVLATVCWVATCHQFTILQFLLLLPNSGRLKQRLLPFVIKK